MANDLYHLWGGDIAAGSNGDLMPVDGSTKTTQRILRRLMTNPGDYLDHPDYGAGLPQFVGRLVDIPKVRGLIRGQMLLDEAVARTPEPAITVSEIANGMACSIQYYDAVAKSTQTLSFNVTA